MQGVSILLQVVVQGFEVSVGASQARCGEENAYFEADPRQDTEAALPSA